jgi:hypothetical protein
VSGIVPKVPFVGCGYEYSIVWGAQLGWDLNTSLPADLDGKQSVTIGLSGATGLSLSVNLNLPNTDGGLDLPFCAPLNLNNGVGTILFTSFTTDCWQPGGKRFDPVSMKPQSLSIEVKASTGQDTPFNFCLTQLKIE